MNNSEAARFETCNRKLENFLFDHDILAITWYKSDDDLTVWVYPRDEYLDHVLAEWKAVQQRRRARQDEPVLRSLH